MILIYQGGIIKLQNSYLDHCIHTAKHFVQQVPLELPINQGRKNNTGSRNAPSLHYQIKHMCSTGHQHSRKCHTVEEAKRNVRSTKRHLGQQHASDHKRAMDSNIDFALISHRIAPWSDTGMLIPYGSSATSCRWY